MNTIAVDCGASFIKAALFSNEKIIRNIRRAAPWVNNNLFFDKNNSKINNIINIVKEMIKELIDGEDEINLVVSNEMHGFILTHSDGEPYTDYISWQDEYGRIEVNGSTTLNLMKNDMNFNRHVLNSGMPLRSGLPSTNLFYLKCIGKLKEKKLHFYTLGDYIIRCLSNKEPIIHKSNAASTGLYDLSSDEWDYEYINLIGADKIWFPKIGTESIRCDFGKTKVNIKPAIGDQQAALLGAGLSSSRDLSFNLGTGAQVSRIVKFRPEILSDRYQIRPFFNKNYIATIPHIPSGKALNVYFRFIKSIIEYFGTDVSDELVWQEIKKISLIETESQLSCDLSFFENPITNMITGNIENISEENFNFQNLISSVINQMAANYILMSERLTDNSLEDFSNDIKRIVFSGGIAKSFESIRNKICNHYPGTISEICDNETLIGLNIYSSADIG